MGERKAREIGEFGRSKKNSLIPVHFLFQTEENYKECTQKERRKKKRMKEKKKKKTKNEMEVIEKLINIRRYMKREKRKGNIQD